MDRSAHNYIFATDRESNASVRAHDGSFLDLDVLTPVSLTSKMWPKK